VYRVEHRLAFAVSAFIELDGGQLFGRSSFQAIDHLARGHAAVSLPRLEHRDGGSGSIFRAGLG
jgi:hypothetical protein